MSTNLPVRTVECRIVDLIKAYGDGIPLHLIVSEVDARELFPNSTPAFAEIECASRVLGALAKLHRDGAIGYFDHGIGKVQWELAHAQA